MASRDDPPGDPVPPTDAFSSPLSSAPQPTYQNRYAAGIVLAVGLVIAASATLYVRSTVEKAARQEFASRCDDIRTAIADRMDAHATILLGGAALFDASDRVTREEWRVFTQRQNVEQRLPGIQGIGFALLLPPAALPRHIEEIRSEGFPQYTVKPEGDREVYSSILYLEPFADRNLRAFGYDMLSEPVRRTAMERARDTNYPALSGKVVLVQETSEDVQVGTLMYAPVYRKGMPTDSIEQRRAAIYGWVYSPYRMDDLMRGVIGSRNLRREQQIHLQVFDGEQPSLQSLLHDSHPAGNETLSPGVRFTQQVRMDISGHCWTVCCTQAGTGVFTAAHIGVWLTMVGGALVAFLLFGLVRVLENTGVAVQRRAEELSSGLRESEERYRTIIQTAMDGFWLADVQGGLLAVNDAYCRMSGYSDAELLALRIPKLEATETADDTASHIQRIMAQGQDRFESRHRRKDGTLFDVEVRAQYRPAKDGRVVAFLRDITERKQAEKALRASEAEFRAMFEVASIGMAQADPRTGRWLRVNWKMCAITGYSADEMLQMRISELTHPADRQRDTELFERVVRGEAQNYRLEKRYLRKDGTVVWVNVNMAVIRENGQPTRTMATIEDITERQQAEAERARLEARLLQAQKLESVGRLAGGVAHTFNNKLMGIMNYVEVCRDGLPPEHPVCSYLDEIATEALHSAGIAHQLLAFARKQHIAPKVLDLNGVLAGMHGLLRQLLGEDIDLDWRPGEALWPVKLDPVQVDQVLTNLCANARDAIAGVGKVAIETANVSLDDAYCAEHADAAPGEYVRLTISDTGCGMDAQMVANLFEPFFTTQELARGAGLGLATVYGIVRQNQGHVAVQSEVGKGTTFSIYLPREALETDMGPDAMAPEKLPRGTETILLAEDEKSVRITSVLFLKQFGYTVLAAETTDEAVRIAGAHSGPIHLLVTDVIMPGLNGPDLAGLLAGKCPTLKALFMSGYTADVLKARGTLDERMPFLSKPFSRRDLARKVREVLDA